MPIEDVKLIQECCKKETEEEGMERIVNMTRCKGGHDTTKSREALEIVEVVISIFLVI